VADCVIVINYICNQSQYNSQTSELRTDCRVSAQPCVLVPLGLYHKALARQDSLGVLIARQDTEDATQSNTCSLHMSARYPYLT